MNANVDRLYDILGELPEFEGLGSVKACLRAAEALDAAGVVVAEWQYTTVVSNMPPVITSDWGAPTFDATHRHRRYEGEWEPIPEGERHPSDSYTFSPDGKP